MTGKHSTEIKHKLIDIEVEPSKRKLNDENPFLDENICDESENNDYDSDCSLGSMNSLYLNLKKIPKCNNESERVNQKYFYNNNLSKASLSSEKIDLKIYVSKEKRFYDKIKDNNLAKKLNTSRFYGQRELITQRICSLKPLRQLKNKCIRSKLRKTTSSICKFKQRFNKLRTSLPIKHHRRNLTIKISAYKKRFKINKKLIRNQLKVRIPLLQCNIKVEKNPVHTNTIYSSNLMQKLPNNIIESIKDSETILKKHDSTFKYTDIENQLSQLNTSTTNLDDFTDTDDFEDTKVIEDVLKTLYEDCDLFTEM